jgi:CubicO group peptidase (beta-lactamase class C family)
MFTRPALFAVLALAVATPLPAAGRPRPERDRLDSFVRKAMALGTAPGVAIAVVKGKDTAYVGAFGSADRERRRAVRPATLFYVASTTKSFTALAAALLHHRHVVDLDAPLSRSLPAARLHPSLSADAITLRDLLTHTHGISNDGPVVFRTAYSGDFTKAGLLELLAEHQPAPRGRAFAYGNLGYVLAGEVMEKAAGGSWKEIVAREVLAPAGMKATTAWRSRVRDDRIAVPYALEAAGLRPLPAAKSDANMHAAGGHFTNVLDLARYLQAHLDGGRIGGRPVFPAEVLAETRRKQADQDRKFGDIQRFGWGLGWDLGRLDGEVLVHRFGSFPGYHSHLSFMPDHGLGVAVLVNESEAGGRLAGLIAGYAYELWLGRPDLDARYEARLDAFAKEVRDALAKQSAERAARPRTLPRPPAEYAGVYESPAMGRIELRVAGEGLEARMGVLSGLRVELGGAGFVVEPEFAAEGGPATRLKLLETQFSRTPP